MLKVGGKYDCTAIARGSFEGYAIVLYSVVVVTQLYTHIKIHRIHKSISKEKSKFYCMIFFKTTISNC